MTQRIKNVLKKLGLSKKEKNLIFTLVSKMNHELLKPVSIKQQAAHTYMLFEFCSKSMYFLDTGMRIHTITYFQIFKLSLTFYLLVLKAGI